MNNIDRRMGLTTLVVVSIVAVIFDSKSCFYQHGFRSERGSTKVLVCVVFGVVLAFVFASVVASVSVSVFVFVFVASIVSIASRNHLKKGPNAFLPAPLPMGEGVGSFFLFVSFFIFFSL